MLIKTSHEILKTLKPKEGYIPWRPEYEEKFVKNLICNEFKNERNPGGRVCLGRELDEYGISFEEKVNEYLADMSIVTRRNLLKGIVDLRKEGLTWKLINVMLRKKGITTWEKYYFTKGSLMKYPPYRFAAGTQIVRMYHHFIHEDGSLFSQLEQKIFYDKILEEL